ncbi:semaphorin-4A-like [Cyclopterus lumpus]|uniref:semaphorin-4A-like n=1 Tax=Cyclopterus lumpus TaxID=8103 RepID=UPI0014871C8E|nr:semaphorin-4A-like [Cyclopterus lumpus]
MAPSVLLLLGLLSSSGSLPPPRTSFLLNSPNRPLVLFSPPDLHNTTTLLLSTDGSTLYVGARDAVLSLDVSQSDVIRLKKKVEWRPSQSEINSCQSKGKNAAVDCPNFVNVVQMMNSTHLYVCGSFAYSPKDAFIDAESFRMERSAEAKDKARCPHSPVQKSTAISVDGELFTATTTDFRGVKPQISRHFSKDGRQDVSQDSSVRLLEEPMFVGSSSDPSERKLYFFFTEVGKEFSFMDEVQIARVAQVCKDDVGGQRTLQNKWTSFSKAPLLCQVPKQLPFNVVQDVFTLRPPEGGKASEMLFYGVFTSQWSSGPGSAVCVFKLQDVRAAFSGSYRTFDMETHQLSSLLGKASNLGQCGLDSASDLELAQVKKSFLTSGSVRGDPIVVSSGHQYSQVAAMRTQAASGNQYTVLFLLTESGLLHKVALLDRGAQVVEEIQVFTQPQLVKSMVLSSSKGVLYVGTSEGVTAVPVARCSIYRSCSQCVLARDPLCGWSRTSSACTSVDARHQNMAQDLKDGNVGEQCWGETTTPLVKEVNVLLNEAVRLRCLKPSNLATLTWTSSRFKSLPEKVFILSVDGGLSFLAAAATFGSYRCEAEEGGYKEVVASYDVQQVASPRAFSPVAKETYEELVAATMQPTGDPEEELQFTTDVEHKTDPGLKNDLQDDDPGITPNPGRDARSGKETLEETRVEEKSFYGELVAVSLLLAICVLALTLGGLHAWRQRKAGLKMSRLVGSESAGKNGAMESIPSLSGPEDGGPECKAAE